MATAYEFWNELKWTWTTVKHHFTVYLFDGALCVTISSAVKVDRRVVSAEKWYGRADMMFGNNFGKCGQIFTRWFVRKVSMYIPQKKFHHTYNTLQHYLVKFHNPKMLPNFHVERDTSNTFKWKFEGHNIIQRQITHKWYKIELYLQ